ncbi:MAG: hypothetical protein IJR85_04325 [Synergistaceae bacterium]|nr:hypothetical protein [Synergistaceae bacterium]
MSEEFVRKDIHDIEVRRIEAEARKNISYEFANVQMLVLAVLIVSMLLQFVR